MLAALRELRAGDGWVKQRDLLRKVRSIEPKDIAGILERLAQEGVLQVRQEVSSRGGSRSFVIRIAPPPETV